MPINYRELIRAISIVADNANVRVCVKQSGKGAIVCGAICLAGAILLGPPGLVIGGTMGGLTAYIMSKGTYRPIGEILINELTEQQQEQFVQHVQAAIADVDILDLAHFIHLISNNADIQTAVLRTVIYFVTNELRMQIVD